MIKQFKSKADAIKAIEAIPYKCLTCVVGKNVSGKRVYIVRINGFKYLEV